MTLFPSSTSAASQGHVTISIDQEEDSDLSRDLKTLSPSSENTTFQEHVAISIVQEQDSDLDRGLRFFSDFVSSHLPDGNLINTVKLLFDQNQENQHQIEQLAISKANWSKTKKICLIISVGTTAYALIADLLDQLLSPDDRRQQGVRIAIVISAALLVVTSSIIGFIAWQLQGRRHDQLKKTMELHETDISVVKKIRTIIEAWGSLLKAREDSDAVVDVDRKIKTCFKNIQKIPVDKTVESIPDRNILVSATIRLLPSDHPLNQTITKLISTQPKSLNNSDSDSSSEGAFHDVGQKGHRNPLYNLQKSDSANNINHEYWLEFEKLMGGLYVERLHVKEGQELVNPTHPNIFFRNS